MWKHHYSSAGYHCSDLRFFFIITLTIHTIYRVSVNKHEAHPHSYRLVIRDGKKVPIPRCQPLTGVDRVTMCLKLICHDDSQVASDSLERALFVGAEGYTTLTTWAAGLQTSKAIAHRLRSVSWLRSATDKSDWLGG